MKKMWIVFRQEYLDRIRTRGFVLGTLLFPAFMALLIALPSVFMSVDVEKPARYAVVDSTGALFARLEVALADTNDVGARLYELEQVPPGGDPVPALTQRVQSEELGGFFVIGAGVTDGEGAASFYAQNVADEERNSHLRRVLGDIVRELRIERSQLAAEEIEAITKPVEFQTFRVREQGDASEDKGHTFLSAYIFGILFYITLFGSGAAALRTTLEEKMMRSAELMISTVRPLHLMGGKVLAVAGVTLTQLAIWFVAGAALIGQGATIPGGTGAAIAEIQKAGPSALAIACFFLFFVLGFLFYSGLFVAVGAMVNSETEAQQLQLSVMMPIIVAFMMMFLAIRDPDGTFIRIMSLIPFFSPILMVVRVTVLAPPIWEIGLCIAILIASIFGSMWLSARIFRVGLLMYGKRPTLPELVKWIRYA